MRVCVRGISVHVFLCAYGGPRNGNDLGIPELLMSGGKDKEEWRGEGYQNDNGRRGLETAIMGG